VLVEDRVAPGVDRCLMYALLIPHLIDSLGESLNDGVPSVLKPLTVPVRLWWGLVGRYNCLGLLAGTVTQLLDVGCFRSRRGRSLGGSETPRMTAVTHCPNPRLMICG
jgi:hypothetical protein